MKKTLHRRSGQTVIEFALVSVLFIFLLVVTFNAILAFGTQQYFSYVAFMAARAYQAAGANRPAQEQAAREALAMYIPGFAATQVNQVLGEPGLKIQFRSFGERPIAYIRRVFVPISSQGDYSSVAGLDRDTNGNPQSAQLTGSLPVAIQIEFKVPFAAMPLGRDVAQRIGFITMYAQSYLGRQVSQAECRQFFAGFLQKYLVNGVSFNFPQYMEDNGC